MLNEAERSFSPFYKVKKELWVLRHIFGFPLIATNDGFDDFKFNPWLEIFRYLIFWILFCCSSSYGFYTSYKCTNELNPMHSLEKVWGGIGLSFLDVGVLTAIAPINHFCNLLYIFSFRNGVIGINRISKNLTKLNEEFHGILVGYTNVIIKTKKVQCHLQLRNFFIFIIALIAAIMMAYSWESMMFKKYPNILSFGEKASFVVILTLTSLVYIYPPMAKSADFVVGFLLEEIDTAFGYFNLILNIQQKGNNDQNPSNMLKYSKGHHRHIGMGSRYVN